jgi:hypothetical protein
MRGRHDQDDGLAPPSVGLAALAGIPPLHHRNIDFAILQLLGDGWITINHDIKG